MCKFVYLGNYIIINVRKYINMQYGMRIREVD